MNSERVAVLGASPNPDRASNQTLRSLQRYGHTVIPIHPAREEIEGLPVVHDLAVIEGAVDTLTIYVGPRHGEELVEKIIALSPGRVILNPGTESELIKRRLRAGGIQVICACTLVLLASGQFTAHTNG